MHSGDVTHCRMWHDAFIYVTWLTLGGISVSLTLSYLWRDSFTYMTWLISHMWHGSHQVVFPYSGCRNDMIFAHCVTWLMYICDVTHSHTWHDLHQVVFPYLGLQQRAEALIKDSQMNMYVALKLPFVRALSKDLRIHCIVRKPFLRTRKCSFTLPCHICKWGMAPIWMSHVTYTRYRSTTLI